MGCDHSVDKNKLIYYHFDKIRNNGYKINGLEILNDAFDKKIVLFKDGIFNTHCLYDSILTNAEITYLYNEYSDVTKMKPIKKIKYGEVIFMRSIQCDKKLYPNALYSLFYMEEKQLKKLFPR
jgi:hypothetical protein